MQKCYDKRAVLLSKSPRHRKTDSFTGGIELRNSIKEVPDVSIEELLAATDNETKSNCCAVRDAYNFEIV